MYTEGNNCTGDAPQGRTQATRNSSLSQGLENKQPWLGYRQWLGCSRQTTEETFFERRPFFRGSDGIRRARTLCMATANSCIQSQTTGRSVERMHAKRNQVHQGDRKINGRERNRQKNEDANGRLLVVETSTHRKSRWLSPYEEPQNLTKDLTS